MLTLTEKAGDHLAQILDASDVPAEAAVRLVSGQSGLSLAADQPRPEDTTFEHNGRTVLVLDQTVANALSDNTIDVEETEKGKSLAIR